MMIYLAIVSIIIATFLGGFLALKLKRRLGILMAFSAGLLLSLFFFELLPEIKNSGDEFGLSFQNLAAVIALGFLAFHLLEKFILIDPAHEEDCRSKKHQSVGNWGATGLSLHGFFDGLIVGAGFQADILIGLFVALAVALHKITDGLNISVWLLKNKENEKKIFFWLGLNSLISAVGVFFGWFIALPSQILVYFLAFFAGFLLYIGASDLLPEAHREKNSWVLVLATIIGFVVFFALEKFLAV